MKKQLIAKLLVLGMVLAMLPTAALASANTATDASNNTYVYDFGFIFDDYTFSGAETPAEPEKPAEPETPAETTPVETETNADGQVVATVTVEAEVKGNTATVAVTAEAAADLVSKLVDSKADVLVLPVAAESATKAVVSVPAAALAEMAARTDAALTVESTVANVTISNEALAAIVEGAETVEISAEAKENGTVSIALLADGKAVEDIPGGLDVVIPVEVEAEAVAGVYLVKADETEEELTWEIADGSLKVNLTSTGDVRIDKK